jgi:hypothetical protein
VSAGFERRLTHEEGALSSRSAGCRLPHPGASPSLSLADTTRAGTGHDPGRPLSAPRAAEPTELEFRSAQQREKKAERERDDVQHEPEHHRDRVEKSRNHRFFDTRKPQASDAFQSSVQRERFARDGLGYCEEDA